MAGASRKCTRQRDLRERLPLCIDILIGQVLIVTIVVGLIFIMRAIVGGA